MEEDTGQELERIESSPVGVGDVLLMSVPRAVRDHSGLGIERQTLEADRRPQEVAGDPLVRLGVVGLWPLFCLRAQHQATDTRSVRRGGA